eukprot:GEMP01014271.1.p1 GENE.GEMP01014271.1~~GEMP01014271.1.p1  ORF type:complete len:611 (+),score=114.03 GEMP01014271.1:218-2050(+)
MKRQISAFTKQSETTTSITSQKEYKVKCRWSYHDKTVRPIKLENTALILAIDFSEAQNTSNMKELRQMLLETLRRVDAFDALDPHREKIDPMRPLQVDRQREIGFVAVPQPLGNMSEGEVLAHLSRKLHHVEFLSPSAYPGIDEDFVDALRGLGVYDVCYGVGLIKDVFVMHDDTSSVDLTNYRSTLHYYGPQVVLYSVFMGQYKRWLALPAIVGVLMYAIRSYDLAGLLMVKMGMAPAGNELLFLQVLYGLFLTVWATLFVENWKRKIAEQIHNFDMESYEISTSSIERQYLNSICTFIKSSKPKFEPPIKDLTKKSDNQAMKQYLQLTVALFCGACIVAVVIYFLNILQDIVDADDNWPGLWKQAPFALYIVVMIVLEGVYNSIAERLTEWEAHRLQKEATKSLVMKKTLFVYLNMFGYPLYVAFYQKDLAVLRQYVFLTVSIKQIFLGAMIEMAPLLFSKAPTSSEWVEEMKKTYDKPPADVFMEYLEMFLDFGFLVLFSQFCEWIALWSLVHTVLEMATDQMKFRMQRRFFGYGFLDARDLAGCFEAASLLGVVTGAAYFIIVCPQEWTLTILAVEHCVIFFKLYLSMMIPDEPEEVSLSRMKKDL